MWGYGLLQTLPGNRLQPQCTSKECIPYHYFVGSIIFSSFTLPSHHKSTKSVCKAEYKESNYRASFHNVSSTFAHKYFLSLPPSHPSPNCSEAFCTIFFVNFYLVSGRIVFPSLSHSVKIKKTTANYHSYFQCVSSFHHLSLSHWLPACSLCLAAKFLGYTHLPTHTHTRKYTQTESGGGGTDRDKEKNHARQIALTEERQQ